MSSEDDLTLLQECGDQIEVSTLRSLLDAHGIRYVVQGEHHSVLVGGLLGNPAIRPRLLVARRDLEAAVRLLEALPMVKGVEGDGAMPEGAQCPVHEQAAVATCARCGTFLCASCNALGKPPLCEECDQRDDVEAAARSAKANRRRKQIVLALFALMTLPFLIPLILEWFR